MDDTSDCFCFEGGEEKTGKMWGGGARVLRLCCARRAKCCKIVACDSKATL